MPGRNLVCCSIEVFVNYALLLRANKDHIPLLQVDLECVLMYDSLLQTINVDDQNSTFMVGRRETNIALTT